MATQLLMGDEERRRDLGLKLGSGMGGAIAAGLATGLAGADQGPEAKPKEGEATGQTPGAPDDVANEHQQAFIQDAQSRLEGFRQLRQQTFPDEPETSDQAPAAPAPVSQAGGAAESPFALAPMLTGATLGQTLDVAQMAYMASVARPSEAPLPSRAGTEQAAFEQATGTEYGLAQLAVLEQFLSQYRGVS
jgi:hypothetical protein